MDYNVNQGIAGMQPSVEWGQSIAHRHQVGHQLPLPGQHCCDGLEALGAAQPTSPVV